jgi:alkanesulfonate monooxygenase SsuD/methylene tetrahydromethanopterin reductase-like flavin-dependent oxidoreductase (luciferase family)
MRAGIVILPDQRWSIAAQQWRRAEAYGFVHAWTYDHIGWRDLVGGPWFDNVPTLTAAALATSRIRLGTMVASPNFGHPAHFAREVTALDGIAGGRLIFGGGAGGVAGYDNHVLGQAPLTARSRVDRFGEVWACSTASCATSGSPGTAGTTPWLTLAPHPDVCSPRGYRSWSPRSDHGLCAWRPATVPAG